MLRYLTGPRRALAPRLYEELREALASGRESLLVLVPEQYTLEAERELMDALNLPGSFRLQVLSPGRLCRLAFEQAGYPQPVRIDERGCTSSRLPGGSWTARTRCARRFRACRTRPLFGARGCGRTASSWCRRRWAACWWACAGRGAR